MQKKLLILFISLFVSFFSYAKNDGKINPDTFITKWKISNSDKTLTIPIRNGYFYNFEVNWGDGNFTTVGSYNDAGKNHVYAKAGEYIVSIKGKLQGLSFNSDVNEPHKDKLIEVINLGDMGWINLQMAFLKCTNLISFKGGNTDKVTSMFGMFAEATSLVNLDLSSFNTENVTSMEMMFYKTISLKTLDLSKFNTSNVATMERMFARMYSLKNLDLGNFNTENVISMKQMFYDSYHIREINLQNFNTINVVNKSAMFTDTHRALKLKCGDHTFPRDSKIRKHCIL